MKRFYLIFLFIISFQPANAQWVRTNIQTGFFVHEFHEFKGELFVVMGKRIFKTSDQGENWQLLSDEAIGFDQVSLGSNEDYLFAGTTGNGILRSSDSGLIWERLTNGLPNRTFEDIVAKDSILIAGTSAAILIQISRNLGNTWERANVPFPPGAGSLYKMAIYDSLVIACLSEAIYRSEDLGMTWEVKEISNSDFKHIAKIEDTLYIGDTGSGVYRSTDSGATWELIITGLEVSRNIIAMGIYKNKLLVRTAGMYNLLAFSPENDTWLPFIEVPDSIDINALIEHDGLLFAGTFNNGIWKIDPEKTTSSSEEKLQNKEIKLFPNPTSELLHIQVNDFPNAIKKLEFYNTSGQILIQESWSEEQLTLNINHLPGGIYFVKMEVNGKVITEKVAVIR